MKPNSKLAMGLILGAALVGYGFRPNGFLATNESLKKKSQEWGLPPPAVVALVAYLYLRFAKPRTSTYQFWAAWGVVAVGVYWTFRMDRKTTQDASTLMGVSDWAKRMGRRAAANPFLRAGANALAPGLAPVALDLLAPQQPQGVTQDQMRIIVRQELARRAGMAQAAA